MADGVVLFGGGGHCRSVIDVLETLALPVAGVVHGKDDALEPVFGYPALGRDEDVQKLRAEYSRALVTVGQIRSATTRRKLFSLLKSSGFTLPVVVSPLARASSRAHVGEGTVVMHHALLNAGARVGKNCIVNSKALVEHDCDIADHCHVAVGAFLCGGVRVGEGSFIGAGAVIHPMVTIGRDCIIPMGSRVFKDMPDGARAT